MNPLLDAALEYAALGWPVLPVGGDDGKKPLIKHGVSAASTDPEQIRKWWRAHPHANVAVATGYPGPDVLDIDDPEHADDRAIDRARFGSRVATARGLHVYFTGTEQRTLKLPYGELRRQGSYVIAPPSVRPDNGHVYAWATGSKPSIPEALDGAPEWLSEGRKTAGTGVTEPVERVARGDMYDHLLDLAVRLARAGILDGALRERILAAEFERVRIPGEEYGGDAEDTRRLAYAATEILEREAHDRLGETLTVQPSTQGIGQLEGKIDVLVGEKAIGQLEEWSTEDIQTAEFKTDWLIPGLIGKRWFVLVTGREKTAGKGTLITYLLSRVAKAEPTPWGDTTESVTAYIVSEEPGDTLQEKHRNFGLTGATVLFGSQLAKLHLEWPAVVKLLVDRTVAKGHGILYLDNISRTARAENDDESGTGFARKVELLADTAREAGLTLIVDHHNRKSGGKIEDRFRGGTALPGATDNHINIEHVGGWVDRRRKLSSRGRVSTTIWEKVIELNADGTDYTLVDTVPELTVLLEQDTWTIKQLMAAADISRNTARERLNEYGQKTSVEGREDVWTVDHKRIQEAIEREASAPPV